ncbi:uncharacterized protein LOC115921391 [Strongylocentrotus purpuratus]|uniref:DDE-1 domain-containing protein n=1 Tax=Strongylocentrotus purpuratus TaxID=7668 RepID=A0A7M7NCS4_STRPU|nr:uncharacterized protein LOC115921391 [Strongylocentrotus purpuratus]
MTYHHVTVKESDLGIKHQLTLVNAWLVNLYLNRIPQCSSITRKGLRCRRDAKIQGQAPKCTQHRFLKRNPRLSLRTPQAIGKERAIVTVGTINKWFDEFESYLKEVNAMSILTEPNRMFNCDESGFALGGGGKAGKRVLAEKGSKVVHVVKSSDKSQVTVLATVSATGTFPPPLIVLPGIRAEYHYGHMVGAPKGAFFGRTESGWMDSKTFLGFVTNLFHPFLVRNKIPLPVLLLVDGHSTHQSLEVARFCHENGIILYRLPPHATHLLQPCDVSVFRSLKAEWYKAERQYRIDHPGNFLTKRLFASVFREAWEKVAAKPSLGVNGFKAAGLYPFTKEYKTAHLLPSTLYNLASYSTTRDDPSTSFSDSGTPASHLDDRDNPSSSSRGQGTPASNLDDRDNPSSSSSGQGTPASNLDDRDNPSSSSSRQGTPSSNLDDRDNPRDAVYDEQKTSFLELESHRLQINKLQNEVDKLKVTLEQREVDNAALGAEVTRLKMFIADHCADKTPIPAIVQAVKDKINPHVLISKQFKLEEMDQRLRMDNLGVSGLSEPQGEEEESAY